MNGSETINTILGIGTAVVLLVILYRTRIKDSQLWTITVTPLASIIGSGFLITAPLLYANFGTLAVPAIILISVLALGVGMVIRHNIEHFDEHQSEWVARYRLLGFIERSSNLALGASYTISVAFYVTLMSAFALETLAQHSPIVVRMVSTNVLAFIGVVGYYKGLHGLESLEKIAVNVKMSIIGGLLLVLFVFSLNGGGSTDGLITPVIGLQSFQILGGMLLITQGFETTKYLGHEYEAQPRIKASLLAQIIATGVYIMFVVLVAPLVIGVDASSETAIIGVIAKLAAGLGLALSIGAIFSQFSAAVADTVGTGGIVAEETQGRFSDRRAYVGVAIASVAIIWLFDIFAVFALASRAFATYYGLQCIIATVTTWHLPPSTRRTLKLIIFPILTVLMFLILLFAVPVE